MQEEAGVWRVSWKVTAVLFLGGPWPQTGRTGAGQSDAQRPGRQASEVLVHVARPACDRRQMGAPAMCADLPLHGPDASPPANEVFWRPGKDH